jgi:hypothetical protein
MRLKKTSIKKKQNKLDSIELTRDLSYKTESIL